MKPLTITKVGRRRTGSADLPLHYGTVPKFRASRMSRLGVVMAEAIIHHYGRDELLRCRASPFRQSARRIGMPDGRSGKRGLSPSRVSVCPDAQFVRLDAFGF